LASILAPLVDAPALDLEQIGHVLIAEDAEEASLDFDRLLRLASRLPSGLVHAESVWITSVPAVGLAPLAPGSAWSALDRQLIVTVAPGRAALISTAVDLARYALGAAEVGRILGPQRELVEALLSSIPLDSASASRLALALGADPELIATIDRRAPGLRADLGSMGRRAFRPMVQLHPSTRPSRWRRLGTSIARRLIEALPPGPFRLVVADSSDVVEHLSPYTRDLMTTLTAWAQENPHEIAVRGLVDALAHTRGHPVDHAALVARDLMRAYPEALVERRMIERASGLELFDEAHMVFGYADVGTLPAPDQRAIPAGSRGTLAVVAGPSDETLVAATAALLETGRVEGLALAGASGPDLDGPCGLPELLVSADDAVMLEGASRLARRVESLGIRLGRGRRLMVDGERGAPPWAFDLLRLARRATLTGLFPVDGRQALALYARSASPYPDIDLALGSIQAARVALMGLQLSEASPAPRGPDASKPSSSMRFRA